MTSAILASARTGSVRPRTCVALDPRPHPSETPGRPGLAGPAGRGGGKGNANTWGRPGLAGTAEGMIDMASASIGAGLDQLALWLRTESPTHAPGGVNQMMDLVTAEVAEAPVAVERIPGRAGLGDALVLRAGPETG